ncbi:hypothetical protein PMAYCL1PPCAC_28081, partial [Pristionchus mayeri]
SGGSSGGEGPLIGAGGSLVGLGSDVGGSSRIPHPLAVATDSSRRPHASRFSNTANLCHGVLLRAHRWSTRSGSLRDSRDYEVDLVRQIHVESRRNGCAR